MFIQNIISIIHLAKAQNAKIQIMIVHTSSEREKISQNQIKANKNPQIQSNQTNSLFLFLKALITADIHEVNRKNHNIMSINLQNILGEQIVIIQKIITTIHKPIINEYGRDCI